jgi:hypothetical protein
MRELTTDELKRVSAGKAPVLATGQGAAVFSLATLLYAGRSTPTGCPAGCTCA